MREDKVRVLGTVRFAMLATAPTPRPVHPTVAPRYFALESLRDKLKAEPELVILFDDSFKGDDVRKLVDFGESLGIPVKYICLVDYSNSRGAVDMGLTPELLPGYKPTGQPGMHLAEMIARRLWTCSGWSAPIR